MLALTLGVALAAVQSPCTPGAMALVVEASASAAAFDLPDAAERLRVAVARGCAGAAPAALYVRGLLDAREAFRQGGAPASLMQVRYAITALEELAQNRPGPAEIARLVLYAAAAAAQSERDEMRLYLDSAIRMETVQRAASQPGAPVITATEVAGDLWLQVHRYDEARQAYDAAAQQVGSTLRVLAGRARAAVGLIDAPAACTAFRRLVEQWGTRQAEPPELSEARAYLRGAECR